MNNTNRGGTNPYYQYAVQWPQQFAFAWHGGAGGVMAGAGNGQQRAASSRGLSGLGIFDLLESESPSGAAGASPALSQTRFHHRAQRPVLADGTWSGNYEHDQRAPWATGDWPLVRPAGPEPMDPHEGTHAVGLGFLDSLSDNEKTLALLLAAGGVGWWLWKRGRRGRRNPGRIRYEVFASGRSGGGLAYAMSFTKKRTAKNYADALRLEGRRASVRRA